VTGIDSPYAESIRSRLFDKATKVVLRSLTGVESPAAWRMRVAAAEETKEALDSVDGMDAPEAWHLRERFVALWPSTAISSLRHLAPSDRGLALIDRALADNPGRLSVLRNAWATLARAGCRPGVSHRGPAQMAAVLEKGAEAP
jgi:dTMP kinase